MVVVQCKILQIVNIPSKAMQCKTIDLISAHKLLQNAAEDIVQLRRSFDAVLNEASTFASTWGLPRQLLNKRALRLRLKEENFLTNFLMTSLRCFLAKCFSSKRRLEKRLSI